MEKKWYRAPFIKGVLVVLAHIAVVASLMGFTWVILCAGVNYVNPTAKIPESYAQTRQFSKNMNNALYEMTWTLFGLDGIEKDGKLNEEMLIDLEKYYNTVSFLRKKEKEMNLYINFLILLMQKIVAKKTEKSLFVKRPMGVMLMKNGEVFKGNCFPENLYLLN